jgi:hypothetical protein
LGFLAVGFTATMLFVVACSGKFNTALTALKDVLPIFALVAISPLALKKIEASQEFDEKMDLLFSNVKIKEDERLLEECWEKEFEDSNGELR